MTHRSYRARAGGPSQVFLYSEHFQLATEMCRYTKSKYMTYFTSKRHSINQEKVQDSRSLTGKLCKTNTQVPEGKINPKIKVVNPQI
jgi:hypothetical protein